MSIFAKYLFKMAYLFGTWGIAFWKRVGCRESENKICCLFVCLPACFFQRVSKSNTSAEWLACGV